MSLAGIDCCRDVVAECDCDCKGGDEEALSSDVDEGGDEGQTVDVCVWVRSNVSNFALLPWNFCAQLTRVIVSLPKTNGKDVSNEEGQGDCRQGSDGESEDERPAESHLTGDPYKEEEEHLDEYANGEECQWHKPSFCRCV